MYSYMTLYRSVEPDHGRPIDAEYYQIRIEHRETFHVIETHGFFDAESKEAINATPTLDETFDEYPATENRYREQVHRRVLDGYVHSFTRDPFRGELYRDMRDIFNDDGSTKERI